MSKTITMSVYDAMEQQKEIEELREENKELKENLEEVAKELIQHHEEYKNMADMVVKLRKQIDKLRTDNIYEEGLYD